MKIYDDVDAFPILKYPVVTDGTFDGVHLGHQKIINRLTEIAKKHGGETVLLTFWPHPRTVLNPNDHGLQLLTSFDEKAKLLAASGIQHLIKINFTHEFSQISPRQFVEHYLIKCIRAKKLVIGYDHRFGKNREGSFQYLLDHSALFGFEIEEISKQDLDDIAISSSVIRKSLIEGDVQHATKYLGRYYSFQGKIVRGNQLGRELGFPTANIVVDEPLKLIPGDGAYAVKVIVNNELKEGMLNIGYRPTINGKNKSIEVHIFDFNEDIYDQMLEVRFVAQIRTEKKFESKKQLELQLHNDKLKAINILKEN